jgi:hypothetical protein
LRREGIEPGEPGLDQHRRFRFERGNTRFEAQTRGAGGRFARRTNRDQHAGEDQRTSAHADSRSDHGSSK